MSTDRHHPLQCPRPEPRRLPHVPPENALPVTACVDRAPGLWRANIRLRYLGVFANDEPLHAFEVTPPGLVA